MILSTLLLTFAFGSGTIQALESAQDPPLIRLPLVERTNLQNRYFKRDGYTSLLYNSHGTQYLVSLSIGTPAQNFTVTLDTGSGDLWVPSTDCPSQVCPVARYDSQASSTYNATDIPFKITYGIGAADGVFIKDTVTIGGVSIKQQQLAIASNSTNIFTRMTSMGLRNTTADDAVPADGLLGLGYPDLTSSAHQKNGSAYTPFVFNLMQQNLIKDPVFSIYLNSANEQNWAGEIIFGGVDSTKYSGNISYVPVQQITAASASSSSYMFWVVYGQGVAVNGGKGTKPPNIQYATPLPTIIDTGTTLSYLPEQMVLAIVEAIVGPGSNYQQDPTTGMYVLDCSVANQKTTIQLQMTSSSAASKTPVVIDASINDVLMKDQLGNCYLAIAPSDATSPFGANSALIGQSILRSAYMVFDMGQNRIGFAPSIFSEGQNNNAGSIGGGGGGSNNNNNGASGGQSGASSLVISGIRWPLVISLFVVYYCTF